MERLINVSFTVFAVALGSSLGCSLTALFGKFVGYEDLTNTSTCMSMVMACISGLAYIVYVIASSKKYGK